MVAAERKFKAQIDARLEQRQRQADERRGRDPDDQNKPRGKDGKPKGGRCRRDFGVPEDQAQDNFTDPDSRIMQRARVASSACAIWIASRRSGRSSVWR